ncbi:MAG TPA: peptidylprolyl isomerase [Rhodopila sp.]|nr:peptidylprolyl isomerase [Rhodopila sp.]
MPPSALLFRAGLVLACLASPLSAAWAKSGAPAAPAPANVGPMPPPGPAAALPTSGTAPDPVVGSVEGHLIHLSELGAATKTLPENLQGMPFDTLYPVLLDRMIDQQALVIMARRKGLEERKDVRREIEEATAHILERAYLADVAAPEVTEKAIQALYDRQYANRSVTEEVRARHILVTTEAEALKVLDDLKRGVSFATMARVLSKDPDASRGGDLGFFRRDQVSPSLADVAFTLQPGQVAPKPVHNEFGWHVIKVEERRIVAPPTLSDVHDQLKQQLLASAVQQAIVQARAQLMIRKFNIDGSAMNANAGGGLPGQ